MEPIRKHNKILDEVYNNLIFSLIIQCFFSGLSWTDLIIGGHVWSFLRAHSFLDMGEPRCLKVH
jgi:hypothetical protein